MRLRCIVMGLGLGILAGAAHAQAGELAAAPEPKTSAACEAALKDTAAPYSAAVEASKWADAEAIVGRAAEACAQDLYPRAMLMTLKAAMAYHRGDPKRALAIVEDAHTPRDSAIWLMSRLVEAAALKRQGDQARYVAIRDELVAATGAGLTGGPQPYMEKVERFETPYAFVDAYREIPRGRALLETFFLASPKDGAMPESLSVSNRVDDKGHVGADLGHMDRTWCDGNALMTTSPSPGTYADLKRQAIEVFQHAPAAGPADLAGMRDAPSDADLCLQATFIFRGLAPSG